MGMDFNRLVSIYEQLSKTPQRIEKTDILAAFLRQIEDNELPAVILLLQGRVYPLWDSRTLGFSSRSILKATSRASGVSENDVEQKWRETGDLGTAATQVLTSHQQKTLFSEKLTILKVFTVLQKLASLEGERSSDMKIHLVSELLTAATPPEAKFLVRIVLDELRIGMGDGTLRDALLLAFAPVSREDREAYVPAIDAVQRALDLCNDFGVVALQLKTHGLDGIKQITLCVGVPLQVMLSLKEKTISAAYERVGKSAVLEYKLDGFRLQIHKNAGVKLFTRRLENVTQQFPDIVTAVSHVPDNVILDCEVIGVVNNTFVPFQDISQRIKRKHDILAMAEKLPVHVYVFDILFYEKSLLETPLQERRGILRRVVKENERVKIMPCLITADELEAQRFYEQSLAAGNEGIMFKSLDAPYQPGARVGSMVKMKPILETLDLVIVGAEWGEGKRSEWLSSYTVACRTDAGLLNIGHVSTGLKEKEEGLRFQDLTVALKPLVLKEEGKKVVVTPRIVIEIAFEEIQKSSTYGSGYALRFPRVLRLRPDRDEKTCSTLADVERIFREQ